MQSIYHLPFEVVPWWWKVCYFSCYLNWWFLQMWQCVSPFLVSICLCQNLGVSIWGRPMGQVSGVFKCSSDPTFIPHISLLLPPSVPQWLNKLPTAITTAETLPIFQCRLPTRPTPFRYILIFPFFLWISFWKMYIGIVVVNIALCGCKRAVVPYWWNSIFYSPLLFIFLDQCIC